VRIHSRKIRALRKALAVSGAGVLVLAIAPLILVSSPAGATGTPLFNDSFTGTTSSQLWTLPTWPDGSNDACLTAGTNTSATPIPGCDLGTPDASGDGALRLTDNSDSQVGSILSPTPLPTVDGLDISFTSYQYDGSGADGIAFDLAATNPSDPTDPTSVGAAGGSLGYAPLATTDDGIPHAYLGFGLDSWGNFEGPTDDADASCTGTDDNGVGGYSQEPESMGVRGPGNNTTAYCLLDRLNLPNGVTLGSPGATSRSGVAVPVEVVLNPSSATNIVGASSACTVPANGWMFAAKPLGQSTWECESGALPTTANNTELANTSDFPTSWINTTTGLPEELVLGWTASTGAATEIHEITGLSATSLTPAPELGLTNTDSGHGALSPESTNPHITLTASVLASSPVSEDGDITVSDSVPSDLSPTGATGTDWGCLVTGQTLICTYHPTSPIDAGTSLPAITVPVTVAAVTADLTNVASVSSTDGASAHATDHIDLSTSQATTPGAPRDPAVTLDGGVGIVTWSPPVSDGGSGILHYTVTASNGSTCVAVAPATTCRVSGLKIGTSYTFTITATNAVGTGPRARTQLSKDQAVAFFAENSFLIPVGSPSAAALAALARVIASDHDSVVVLTATTDHLGSVSYNKWLSRQRALTVKRLLEIALERLDAGPVSFVIHADGISKIYPTLALNRRVTAVAE
jgi:hypothetical protein